MNPFDFFKKNADKMKEVFKQTQQDIAALKVKGEAGAGMVTVTMDGRKNILSVHIDDSIYQAGKSIVEELSAAAMQDALNKTERLSHDMMAKAMSSLGLPSNFNFPFDPSLGS